MLENQIELTIEELAERIGLSIRTIRFYIAEGLLQGPSTRGKFSHYGEEQLVRLQLIRRLSERRMPLAEMREKLSHLSLDEVRALLAEEEQRTAEMQRAIQTSSPKEYLSTLLKQAQEVREKAMVRPAAPAPISTEKLKKQATPIDRSAAEAWQRWKLAEGIELHVRADAQQHQYMLIEQILKLANQEEQ